jgi:hypothetical protein
MWWWAGCDVVHCGFWINLSQSFSLWKLLALTSIGEGTIRGSTLTLPSQSGLIIVAFLALFVNLVGSHLWGIICFATHQANATSRKQDDTYHQLQLTLRNTKSESNLISDLIKIGHSRKGARLEAYRRSIPLFTLAGLHALAVLAAGTFSSKAIASNDEVLTRSKSCGSMRDPSEMLNITDDSTFELANALVVMARYVYRKSASYSRACYGQHSGHSTACGTYVRSTIPYNMSLSVPCPFDEKICNGLGVAFDTGLIRSDLDLGINTRPEDRLSVRKVLTCAPLAGEKYTDGWYSMQDSTFAESFAPETLWKGWKFGHRDFVGDVLPEYTFNTNEALYRTGDRPYHLELVSHSLTLFSFISSQDISCNSVLISLIGEKHLRL